MKRKRNFYCIKLINLFYRKIVKHKYNRKNKTKMDFLFCSVMIIDLTIPTEMLQVSNQNRRSST